MPDSELKKLLLETCPVRPGQEERAWAALRDRLYRPAPAFSPLAWLTFFSWRRVTVGLVAVCALIFLNNSLFAPPEPVPFSTAKSAAPGIYATSFYSSSAQAQVVWLNGMEPATDQPTYLDPTTVIAHPQDSSESPDNSDSL